MNERMYQEIEEILNEVKGDIIDFRVYKGTTFAFLVKLAAKYDRHAVGIDTFYGLEAPSEHDWNEHNQIAYPKGYAKSSPNVVHESISKACPGSTNYELHGGKLSEVLPVLTDKKYAFALIDLFQYAPTKEAIEYVYSKMSPGGVLYFLNYKRSHNFLASKAINEFIHEKENELYIHPPIVINDNVLPLCKISCHLNEQSLPEPEVVIKNEGKSSLWFKNNKKAKTTIAMVLRTGGDTYDYRYVNALADCVRKHTESTKYNIVCLTDNAQGINSSLVDEVVPFKHNYKGWWSKIELFRPDIFKGDNVFYMDLDTVVVNNIDEILEYQPTFAGIRDLYHHTFMQTGILSWNPNYNHQVYENFTRKPSFIMDNYPEGDARWIRENVYNYEYLQDVFPNKIVSYKAHCLNKISGEIKIPKDASIVCFHGKPRPHTIKHPAITRHWIYK